MNAFVLLIPIIFIRYGLIRIFNKAALKRAAFYPPLVGKEKGAFWCYQVSTLLFFVCLFFLKIRTDSILFYIGLIVFCIGVLFCIVSILNFAKPKESGLNLKGLYRVSRHPIYVAYFIYFSGCVLLTCSLLLLIFLIIFQVSAHWIILSEERWCVKEFGQEYIEYMKKVRRYI